MRASLPRASLLLAAFLAASCASPEVSAFSWKSLEGKTLGFRRVEKSLPGEEARLDPTKPLSLSLSRPRLVPAALSLALELRPGPKLPPRSELGVNVAVLSSDKNRGRIAEARLVLRDGPAIFLLPIPAGTKIGGLELSIADKGLGADYSVDLAGIAEERPWSGILPPGILPGANVLRISGAASAWSKSGESHASLELPPRRGSLPGSTSTPDGGREGIFISYGPGGGDRSLAILADGKKAFSLRLHPAGLSTVLPLSVLPPEARTAELILPRAVAFRAFTAGSLGAAETELADFGRILRAPLPSQGEDFELYRWDLLPEVLVFDFRDYAAQDLYLKRLAFYVEKEGFRGRIAPDSEIAALHGWNAHDYRASDLAAFFSKAKQTGFALSAQERNLCDLLVERGIIQASGEGYAEGRGAIISIARESEPYLRTLFLTHESTHAIFFVDAAYRKFVQDTWKAMDREEKWFWKLYFGWKTYDVDDSYLMANEYQAYLLQQTLKQTEAYFTKNAPAQLTEKHKELLPGIEEYLAKFGGSFVARATALDAWLGAKYGFRAGMGASY